MGQTVWQRKDAAKVSWRINRITLSHITPSKHCENSSWQVCPHVVHMLSLFKPQLFSGMTRISGIPVQRERGVDNTPRKSVLVFGDCRAPKNAVESVTGSGPVSMHSACVWAYVSHQEHCWPFHACRCVNCQHNAIRSYLRGVSGGLSGLLEWPGHTFASASPLRSSNL